MTLTPIQLPPMIVENKGKDPALCAWFLKCDNTATTTREHPILGKVLICERCNNKVEALST